MSAQLSKTEENKKIKKAVTIANNILIIFLLYIMFAKMYNIGFGRKIFVFYNLYKQEIFSIKMLFPYFIVSITIISTIFLSIYISFKNEDPKIFIIILSAYLAQGVMVMAPYIPLRTTLIPLSFFWLGIAYLVTLLEKNPLGLIMSFTIAFASHNICYGALILIVYIITKLIYREKFIEIFVIISLLSIFSAINYYKIYCGYSINKKIYNENFSRFENFIEQNPTQEQQENNKILLIRPNDWRYCMIADHVRMKTKEEDIMQVYKYYFNLDNTVSILYED